MSVDIGVSEQFSLTPPQFLINYFQSCRVFGEIPKNVIWVERRIGVLFESILVHFFLPQFGHNGRSNYTSLSYIVTFWLFKDGFYDSQ